MMRELFQRNMHSDRAMHTGLLQQKWLKREFEMQNIWIHESKTQH